ncbi:glycosyltransferase family 61 protein [Candidatus Planktophila dulcis]|uniref:glycosyltransferase family 61 protein n=1 Tax=Candidatus Planktophila dulcis TaxID=1884914 RepID=UPI003CEA8625
MKTKDIPTLNLKGITRRKSWIPQDLDFLQGNSRLTFLLFPAWRLSRKWNVGDPLHQLSARSKWKSFLILISRVELLLLGFRWVGITLEVDIRNHDIESIQQKFSDWTRTKKVYISREIGFLGFRLDKFDLSLEYDLFRYLNQYDLILTSATISMKNLVYESGSSFKLSEDATLTREFVGILNSTFIPVATQSSEMIQGQDGMHLDSKLVVSGRLNRLGSAHLLKSSNSNSLSCWRYKQFADANIFHGLLVYVDDEFYLSDPKRHSVWGSAFNFIPGTIFQGLDKAWLTPVPESKPLHLEEAIFIGGTNNLMHTVLEDLPRVVLADFLNLDQSTPLIVSSLLSPQIVELLKVISGRQVLSHDLYSHLSVKRLHFFEFDSPLPAIMKGDYALSEELFPRIFARSIQRVLAGIDKKDSQIQRRILILREPGLFRPLTNLEKVKELLVGEFNFEAHYLSGMSLDLVAELFGNAKIIVGEYGAGLANAIHMAPGCKVVEIRGPLEAQAREYEIVAEALGLQHSVLMGKSRILSKYGISRGPYTVPIRNLRQLMSSLIGD